MRQLRGVESHARETHHARFVNVPLLIIQEFAAGLRHGLKERIDRSRPAPFQIVVILLHQIPEAARVLRPGGWAVVELGYNVADTVRRLFSTSLWDSLATDPDLAGIERVMYARRRT